MRRNVSVDGIRQPLKIGVPDWDSSHLVGAIFRIITEEILGINTLLVPCPSSMACLYALIGCKSPETWMTDARCGSPWQPHFHILFEIWMHRQTWVHLELIEQHHRSRYPVFLGTLGYEGYESSFVTSGAVAQAMTQEHLPLDFYVSYSHPRVNLARFFGSPWDVSNDRLYPCNETELAFDDAMRKYVAATGDYEGAVIVDENNATRYVGACPDGHRWLSPACRADRSKCILFLTAGRGWGVDSAMQKAAAWKIPLALAVARSWGDYVKLPKEHLMLMYWWFPDQTFLLQKPFRLVYPEHSPEGWERGDLATEDPRTDLQKLAANGLLENRLNAGLKRPLDVASWLTLSTSEITALLTENLNRSDIEAVVCEWLNGKADLHEWLPSATECTQGQGLLSQQGSFVSKREDANSCQWCSTGRKSVFISNQSTYRCEACAKGKFQAGLAGTSCEPCARGTSAPSTGMEECERCAFGEFAAASGHITCDACPEGFMTLFMGATGSEACVCGEGFYRDTAERDSCLPCISGMFCPASSDAMGLLVENTSQHLAVPVLKPGFWSSQQDPFSVFQCSDTIRCPGLRVPGKACPVTLESQACMKCEGGKYWSGEACIACTEGMSTAVVFPILPILLCVIGIRALYRCSRDEYTKWGNWRNGVSTASFIILAHYQVVNIMRRVDVSPPQAMSDRLGVFAPASDVLSLFRLYCHGFGDFQWRLLLVSLGPLMVIGMYVFVWSASHVTSRWIPTCAMDPNLTLNGCLSILLAFFTGIVDKALILFTCVSNPNGTFTLAEDRSVTCYVHEWHAMLAIGIVAVLVWCIGLFVLFAWVIFRAPLEFHKQAVQRRWKFLFIRYRPDVHWWALVIMSKGALLSLVYVVSTRGMVQLYCTMNVLCLYLVLELTLRPWRHAANTFLDSWSQYGLIMLCLSITTVASLRSADGAQLDLALRTVDIFVYAAALPLLPAVAIMFYNQRSATARRKKREDMNLICDAVLLLVEAGCTLSLKFLDALSESDFKSMARFKDIVQTEIGGRKCRCGYASRQLGSMNSAEFQLSAIERMKAWPQNGRAASEHAEGVSLPDVCEKLEDHNSLHELALVELNNVKSVFL